MRFKIPFALFLACVASSLRAQPTTPFTFRTVAQPGTRIEGHTFAKGTAIESAVINDSGEVAFVATDAYTFSNKVFTSHRIVAQEGDAFDGKTIMIPLSGPLLSINAAGQVAYMALYAQTPEELSAGEPTGVGVFVDRHFVLMAGVVGDVRPTPDFMLTDDGRIITRASAPPAPKKTALLDRIPRMPKGLPISIPSKGQTEARTVEPKSTPQQFPTNRSGQILIPVNFNTGGFLLLLGTPNPK